MPTIFCTHCGHENPDDSRFCASCGNALEQAGAPGEFRASVRLHHDDLDLRS